VTSSVLNTVLDTGNNKFGQEYLAVAVRLLNPNHIRQYNDASVPFHKYSIPGLLGPKYLAQLLSAIRSIVKRWVWDSDLPEVLVVHEMGLAKTFTSEEVVIICKLLT
jgi:hypothetical protein